MAAHLYKDETSSERYRDSSQSRSRASIDSNASLSSTSAILEHIHDSANDDLNGNGIELKERKPLIGNEDVDDEEVGVYRRPPDHPPGRKTVVVVYLLCGVCLAGWLLALFLFLKNGTYMHKSTRPHDPQATASVGNGKPVTLDQVLAGTWFPDKRQVSWIKGTSNEDGLILEKDFSGRGTYLVVQDVRSLQEGAKLNHPPKVLMKSSQFRVGGQSVNTAESTPSRDLENVLVASDRQHNWRHSTTGLYWIYNVKNQQGEPLDPANPNGRIQLATWAPTSDAIAFTRDNNLFLRKIGESKVVQITRDGGADLFYGVPDWVYEEEVFAGASATWWSEDGNYLAYMRTNESSVPDYPVQYFIDRPSGQQPPKDLENYPETRKIKYPKAGAPNPVVSLKFYDAKKLGSFDVTIEGDFPDDDRLITEVVWANDGKVLVRETNRESDILKVVLIDIKKRTGKVVRTVDVNAIDGGWFEVSEYTKFVPNDTSKGRPQDGYIDTVIHKGYDHLGYFTPLDNPDPVLLTEGKWEVIDAPSSVDLDNNLVYFKSTEKSNIETHVYSVALNGTGRKAVTNIDEEGHYDVSFSTGSGYALLTYNGPGIPYQKVVGTESLKGDGFDLQLTDNKRLGDLASATDMPILIHTTIIVDGFELPVVERRPPHFNIKKKYPVLFFLYGGPGSIQVSKKFKVDFQSYVASNLGYIVVTVDGRGTGNKGRKTRCIVRGNVGYYEARDQIATAKEWALKPYVDPDRIAIWGWSYGGFLTLKVLETDAGQTFKYGMAVAPVTDWRYYDTIYTERYMHTPGHNLGGYENATITNVTALSQNVRFLLQHGTGDDNVHIQNSYMLLDRLDVAGIENYDFHAYPDSDHGIYYHNANAMVYGRLSNWLVNAFNGEWLKVDKARPLKDVDLNGKTPGPKKGQESTPAPPGPTSYVIEGRYRTHVAPANNHMNRCGLGSCDSGFNYSHFNKHISKSNDCIRQNSGTPFSRNGQQHRFDTRSCRVYLCYSIAIAIGTAAAQLDRKSTPASHHLSVMCFGRSSSGGGHPQPAYRPPGYPPPVYPPGYGAGPAPQPVGYGPPPPRPYYGAPNAGVYYAAPAQPVYDPGMAGGGGGWGHHGGHHGGGGWGGHGHGHHGGFGGGHGHHGGFGGHGGHGGGHDGGGGGGGGGDGGGGGGGG